MVHQNALPDAYLQVTKVEFVDEINLVNLSVAVTQSLNLQITFLYLILLINNRFEILYVFNIYNKEKNYNLLLM